MLKILQSSLSLLRSFFGSTRAAIAAFRANPILVTVDVFAVAPTQALAKLLIQVAPSTRKSVYRVVSKLAETEVGRRIMIRRLENAIEQGRFAGVRDVEALAQNLTHQLRRVGTGELTMNNVATYGLREMERLNLDDMLNLAVIAYGVGNVLRTRWLNATTVLKDVRAVIAALGTLRPETLTTANRESFLKELAKAIEISEAEVYLIIVTLNGFGNTPKAIQNEIVATGMLESMSPNVVMRACENLHWFSNNQDFVNRVGVLGITMGDIQSFTNSIKDDANNNKIMVTDGKDMLYLNLGQLMTDVSSSTTSLSATGVSVTKLAATLPGNVSQALISLGVSAVMALSYDEAKDLAERLDIETSSNPFRSDESKYAEFMSAIVEKVKNNPLLKERILTLLTDYGIARPKVLPTKDNKSTSTVSESKPNTGSGFKASPNPNPGREVADKKVCSYKEIKKILDEFESNRRMMGMSRIRFIQFVEFIRDVDLDVVKESYENT